MDREGRRLFIGGIIVSLAMLILIFTMGRPLATRHLGPQPAATSSPTSARSALSDRDSGAGRQTIVVGEIGDTMCGRQHKDADKSKVRCIQACINQGASYVLVVSGKVYTLQQSRTIDIRKFAGQRVAVTGTLTGDTLTVQSITREPNGTDN